MKNLSFKEIPLIKPSFKRVELDLKQFKPQTSVSLPVWQVFLNLAIHLLIWSIYKFFFYYFNVVQGGVPARLFWLFTAFSSLIEPLIFYSYYWYFIPQWLEKKKTLAFLLVSVAIIGLVPIVAIHYVDFLRNSIEHLPSIFLREIPYINRHLSISFNLFVFISLASGARFAVDWFKNQRLKVELEKQNMLSEAALLRSQINPHFLFNTLNNIYSLSYKQDNNAPVAILKLSELMRYMLHEAGEEKVSLSKEIMYIQNYIELQKLRLKNPFQVSFEIQGDYREKFITPMLLIPFVENAFKHGVSLQNQSEIRFKLHIFEDILSFSAENPLVNPQLVSNGQNESGIGLKNVKRRLRLLYPEKHEIELYKTENKYFVNLTIEL